MCMQIDINKCVCACVYTFVYKLFMDDLNGTNPMWYNVSKWFGILLFKMNL